MSVDENTARHKSMGRDRDTDPYAAQLYTRMSGRINASDRDISRDASKMQDLISSILAKKGGLAGGAGVATERQNLLGQSLKYNWPKPP